jgi:hypothetical protein
MCSSVIEPKIVVKFPYRIEQKTALLYKKITNEKTKIQNNSVLEVVFLTAKFLHFYNILEVTKPVVEKLEGH